ncbi:MAG: rhodanese-like domain-containing protein [Nevskiales bacterium]
MQQISPQALQQLLSMTRPIVVDVREDWEYAQAHLPGSLHIPMGQIPARFGELDAAQPVVLVCHHGMRSLQAGQFLEKKGFAQVSNLAGGIDAWAEQVDSSMPRY